MNVREKIAELTKSCHAQTDLDAIVSSAGGLGKLFATEFPGADRAEFAYEWDSRKLQIRSMTRNGGAR